MESTEFLVVGCGPSGGTAAREAARRGVETVVLERDAVVGAKRVCAAGLRPGFCEDFDLPRSIVHLDPGTITLSTSARTYAFKVGPAHTTTREELDGTIGELARREGAQG
jgi:flavin-dependent dehydrogenase